MCFEEVKIEILSKVLLKIIDILESLENKSDNTTVKIGEIKKILEGINEKI